MKTDLAQANALARVFGASNLQTNWQTATMELASVTSAASYPNLAPGASDDSRYQFAIDAVLLGVNFSITWITANATEQACVAVAPRSSRLRIVGSPNAFYQSSLFCYAGVTANQLIQRNPGFLFPPPLVRYVQAGTVVQLFGSAQTAIKWRNLATLYFVTVPDYLRMMESAVI